MDSFMETELTARPTQWTALPTRLGTCIEAGQLSWIQILQQHLIFTCLRFESIVGIDLKALGGGSAAEMFEILPKDWRLWPIFTQK